MKEALDAIYEKGVFRPLTPPNVSDGQQVRLIIETLSESNTEEVLELAARVYEGLSQDQIDEIEQIALNRRHFFSSRAS